MENIEDKITNIEQMMTDLLRKLKLKNYIFVVKL